jgi:hypothetical protein
MRKKQNASNKNRNQPRALRKPGHNPTETAEVVSTKTREQQEDQVLQTVQCVTGTQSNQTAERLLRQAGSVLVWPNQLPDKPGAAIIQTAAVMAEMAPQNATEGMLAVQMVATHEAGLMFLARATRDDQAFEARDANVQRATQLLKLHLDQIEAMQKLKGKTGQQTVKVEYVNVHRGGQAIVGVANARGAAQGVGDGEEDC